MKYEMTVGANKTIDIDAPAVNLSDAEPRVEADVYCLAYCDEGGAVTDEEYFASSPEIPEGWEYGNIDVIYGVPCRLHRDGDDPWYDVDATVDVTVTYVSEAR